MKLFVERLKSLIDYGNAIGVTLAIENNVITQFAMESGRNTLLLGGSAEELLEIKENVAHEGLRFLVDVGHLNVSSMSMWVFQKGVHANFWQGMWLQST